VFKNQENDRKIMKKNKILLPSTGVNTNE